MTAPGSISFSLKIKTVTKATMWCQEITLQGLNPGCLRNIFARQPFPPVLEPLQFLSPNIGDAVVLLEFSGTS